nr:uncharacterized protein LOC119175694 [Rhipicephalus microplus]
MALGQMRFRSSDGTARKTFILKALRGCAFSTRKNNRMATVPVEETVVPEGASRGPTGDQTGGSLDAGHARSGGECKVHDHDPDIVTYRNSDSGAGCYESGGSTRRSNEGAIATGSVSSAHSTSPVYCAPSIIADKPVHAVAGDVIETCKYGARARSYTTEATPSTAIPAVGNATDDDRTPAAAAPGGKNGNCRSGKTTSVRIEPPLITPSMRCTIFVDNISVDVEEDQLKALFKPYGQVVRLRLNRHLEDPTSRFAYVLLDSEDNANCAIRELDGTMLNGLALKMDTAIGRMTHLFGIGGGTPFNRSFADQEEWRQKHEARQANGSSNNRQHDDQWRRENDDRNYRQGDRRCGGWNNGNRRHGDRGNCNDHRGGQGHDRFGGYHHNNQSNNRCDKKGNFSRLGGCHGDSGGGHSQHGQNSSGGHNQGGGYRSADEGQSRQRGGGQHRNGRRGDGGHDEDNWCADDHSQMILKETRKKIRDAWTRYCKRLAAEGIDEEWPTFDKLLELIRDTPRCLPECDAVDIESEPEDDDVQLVLGWSGGSADGAGGTGPKLLHWLHGDDAVAEVFRGVAEAAESGGVDCEKRAPREECWAVLEDREGALAAFDAGDGVRDAAITDKRVKASLEKEKSSAKEREVGQQTILGAESTLADKKADVEDILYVEKNTEPSAAPTSEGKNSSKAEDGVSEKVYASSPAILSSSVDVSVESLELSTNENSKRDDTLPSEFVSRCSVSLPNLTEHAEDSSCDRQVNGQQLPQPSNANDDKKDSHATEQPSRKVDSAVECAGKGEGQRRGSSMNAELATTTFAAQGIVQRDSAGPTVTDNVKREAAEASQDSDLGNMERNLSVADEPEFSVETTKDEAGQDEADDMRTVAVMMADRVAALSARNMGPEAKAVWDSEEFKVDMEGDYAGNDENEYCSGGMKALCEDINLRLKNFENALNLSVRQGAAQFSSDHGEGGGRLPSERPVALNVIPQVLPVDEDTPPQSERFEELELGKSSNGIDAHESSADTGLHNRDSGGMVKAEEVAFMARHVSEELRSLLLDSTGGDLLAGTATGGSGKRAAKLGETLAFQRAKPGQQQNVTDSIEQGSESGTCPPGNKVRESELCEGINRDFGAVSCESEQEEVQREVDEGGQTSSALREGGNQRAVRHPRKYVFEESSDVEDKLSTRTWTTGCVEYLGPN